MVGGGGRAPPLTRKAARLLSRFTKKTKTGPITSNEWKLYTNGMLGCDQFIKHTDLEKSKHLMDDSLTVRCDIVVINGFHAEESAPAVPMAFVTVPPSNLDCCFGGLLETGRGADATLDVAGQVRRASLASRGVVLAVQHRSPRTDRLRLRRGVHTKDVSEYLKGADRKSVV